MYATLDGYYDKVEAVSPVVQTTTTTVFRRSNPHSFQANVSNWNVAPLSAPVQKDVINPVVKQEQMSIPHAMDAIDPEVKEMEKEHMSIPIYSIDPEVKEMEKEQMSIPIDAIDPIPEQGQGQVQGQGQRQGQENKEHVVPLTYSMDTILSQHMERPNARTEKAKAEQERQQAEQQLAQFQATQMARLQEQQKERFAHMIPPPQVHVSTEQYSPHIRELQDDTMSSVLTTPTVTLFYAPWCSHCVHMKPIYTEAYEQCKQNGTQVDFTAINGSAWPESTKKYNIVGFPTLMMFSQGKKHVYSGRRISSDICKWISEHL